MRQKSVWCTHMERNARAPLSAFFKVSLLETAEERRQTPSVSSPSTVVSAE
jgi:hypothetical protein